jgi:cell division protein DivIC
MTAKRNQTAITKYTKLVNKHAGLFTLAAVALVIIAIFLFADRGLIHFYNSYRDKENLLQEIEKLEKKKEQLLIEINKLENDPKEIEKIAREKYNMKKKDEKIYQVEMDKEE